MLNDELAKVELFRTLLARSALKDIHPEATGWLRTYGLDPPEPRLM
jgi:hypothetical protein